jgi:hypothetical protein
VNLGAQEIGNDFLGFHGFENKIIPGEFEVQTTWVFFLKSSGLL